MKPACLLRGVLTLAGLLYAQTNLFAQQPKPADSPKDSTALSGLIQSGSGDPIVGASVVILSATPIDGKSLLLPANEADCLKRGTSDDAGRFTIQNVRGDRKFELLVARQGFSTQTLTDVDPCDAPLAITLLPPRPDLIISDDNDVSGRALDANEKPVAGAVILPFGYVEAGTDKWKWQGMNEISDTVISGDDGKFRMPSTKPIVARGLIVRAPGFVPQCFGKVPVGPGNGDVRLMRGATLHGRVVHAGRPQAGVVVGACWEKTGNMVMSWSGPWEAITDDDGRFALAHVTPDHPLSVYGKIESLQDIGALPVIAVTAHDEQSVELGDLSIAPGHTLKGRLKFSDDRPLPPHLYIRVNRDKANDGARSPVLDDGTFELKRLPDEVVTLHLISIPPGPSRPHSAFPFHLSTKNRSLDPETSEVLLGRVDADLEITILLEPGPLKSQMLQKSEIVQRVGILRKKRLQGLSDQATSQ